MAQVSKKISVGDKIWARHGGAHTVVGVSRGKALVGDGSAYFETRRLEWCPVIQHWNLV